jgi:hypothetical protein
MTAADLAAFAAAEREVLLLVEDEAEVVEGSRPGWWP